MTTSCSIRQAPIRRKHVICDNNCLIIHGIAFQYTNYIKFFVEIKEKTFGRNIFEQILSIKQEIPPYKLQTTDLKQN